MQHTITSRRIIKCSKSEPYTEDTKIVSPEEWEYRLGTLIESDPDYVVDVLQVTTEELIQAFPEKVRQHLHEEFDSE
tara:strand:+ start:177 stop:407 length:231 start_codon:yes stop_codon:yes gene_type:complete